MKLFFPFSKLLLVSFFYLSIGFSNVSTSGENDGEKTFKKCKACHQIGSKAKNGVGPHLNQISGRVVGSVKDFKYSNAFLELKEKGTQWDKQMLDKYLKEPSKFIIGTTMKFSGIKRSVERQKLIDFLLQASESSQIPFHETSLSEEILAIVGDRDYGEYLSSECTTCHQTSGKDDGIPSITNWPVDSFVIAMHSYKSGDRKHPIMEMISKRLSNEEIASLAIFFNSINN